jgi:hypothetical protein
MSREYLELLSHAPDGPHTEVVLLLSTRREDRFVYDPTGQFMMDHTPVRYYVKGIHNDIYGDVWDAVMYHDWPDMWVVESIEVKSVQHLTPPKDDGCQ